MRNRLVFVCFVFSACGAGPGVLQPVGIGDLGPNYTAVLAEASPGPRARVLASGVAQLETLTETKGPVDVQLATERTAIEPGRALTVGLIIRHDPGYHTYWRFPGVVGLATRIRWSLPPGFRVGPLRWARPERSRMASYGVWGYRRDVALLTEIIPPSDLIVGQCVEVRADAAWMACAKDCNPGFKSFSLRVPVARKSLARPSTRLFESMRRQSAVVSDAWSFVAERTASGYRLLATPQKGAVAVHDAYLFNSNALVDSNQEQVFSRASKGGFVLGLSRWEYAEASGLLVGILASEHPLTESGQRYLIVRARLRTQ